MTGRPESSSLRCALGVVAWSFCVMGLPGQQPVQQAADSVPASASARCRDGSYSYSATRRGTCSHHGGVAAWLARPEVSSATGRPFDASGYYSPQPRIVVGKYEITTVALHNIDYWCGGGCGYNNPRPVTDPQTLSLRLSADTSQGVPAALCGEWTIRADTLHLACESPDLGTITIDGAFLDKGGDFGNVFSNGQHPKFVLSATVTVSQGGRVVYTARHQFSYFHGG